VPARICGASRYAYLWADGIYCNVRLDDERQCLLVIIGATTDGRKQLLAVHDGFAKRAVLDRSPGGSQGARPGDRSQAGRGRRRVGLLGGAAQGLCRDARAALLGA